MTNLNTFRESTRTWLEENCPPGARGPGEISNGSTKIEIHDADTRLWLERMIEKGWTVPAWPKNTAAEVLANSSTLYFLKK